MARLWRLSQRSGPCRRSYRGGLTAAGSLPRPSCGAGGEYRVYRVYHRGRYASLALAAARACRHAAACQLACRTLAAPGVARLRHAQHRRRWRAWPGSRGEGRGADSLAWLREAPRLALQLGPVDCSDVATYGAGAGGRGSWAQLARAPPGLDPLAAGRPPSSPPDARRDQQPETRGAACLRGAAAGGRRRAARARGGAQLPRRAERAGRIPGRPRAAWERLRWRCRRHRRSRAVATCRRGLGLRICTAEPPRAY